ncbi:MAG: rhodoquinone biosynthesis methyltransferase RquA [Bdellovibrionales bacterium]
MPTDAALKVASRDVVVDESVLETDGIAIPDYLETYYWWAYVRPWAVRIFERDWLINLILWGFYGPLRDRVLAALGDTVSGRTLKISCCYGQLEPMLAQRVAAGGGTLDIIDVAPEQIKNSRRKTPADLLGSVVNHYHCDSNDLPFADHGYDRAIIFFLPHEQPEAVRRKTFDEAFRVVKKGGTIHVVEFAKSKWWHPLRFIWYPVLLVLEPFAKDLWTKEIATWLPHGGLGCTVEKKTIFADFYQLVKITTPR